MTRQKQKQEHLQISIDQLQHENAYDVEATIAPESFDIQEKDGVKIVEPVTVVAHAYLANDYLIIRYDVDAKFEIACALCNEPFELSIQVQHALHEEALEDIPHGIFDLTELMRETILLDIPLFPQCGGAVCDNRQDIEQFLSKEGVTKLENNKLLGDFWI